jgi:uncharacterized protein
LKSIIKLAAPNQNRPRNPGDFAMLDSIEQLHFNNLTRLFRWKGLSKPFALVLVLILSSIACSLSRVPEVNEPGYPLAPPFGFTPVVVLREVAPPTAFPTAPATIPTASVTPPATATPFILTDTPLAPSPTLLPLATPDPYSHLRIEFLRGREYGEGELMVHDVMADKASFNRYLISYPSDGLQIYGFMNVPKLSEGPFPVVIALHGYIDPGVYRTLDYTTHYADALAQAGFLVLHPNLRNYPPSDQGENLFRVGMAVDVLNLSELVKRQGGAPGTLELARPDAIGLWGHSMGGGITLRVVTVNPDIRAAVLYGAMSADERQNFEAIQRWSSGQRGLQEMDVPESELGSISPIYYLENITTPLSIHHGESDQLVPLQWSLDLCSRLEALGKKVECFTYPGQMHTFSDAGSHAFKQRVVDFFLRELQ